MKVFTNFPEKVKACPVCKKYDNAPCVLVGIDGTEDGLNMQAAPVHLHCIELRWSIDADLFYQRVHGGKDYVRKKNDSIELGGHDVVPDAEQRQEDTPGVDVRQERQGEDGSTRSDHEGGVSDSRSR